MTNQEKKDVLCAWVDDPKCVEWKHLDSCWSCWDDDYPSKPPEVDEADCDFRIKPKPKTRPWTLEDVPLPLPIVRAKAGSVVHSVTSANRNDVSIATFCENESIPYSTLMEKLDWYDPKSETWKPCCVEGAE